MSLTKLVEMFSRSWYAVLGLVGLLGFLLLAWGKVQAMAQMPAQLEQLRVVHDKQVEFLRQIKCGVLYDTYKDKLFCIEHPDATQD